MLLRTSNSPVPAPAVSPQGAGRLVDAVGVDVVFGTVPILRGLDLTVAAGDVVAVTGPNGSGKSTLLRLLATLVRPSAGHLELLGHPGSGRKLQDTRRSISYIGHDSALHPDLTVAENLDLVGRLTGQGSDAVVAAIAEVGLAGASARPIRACSAGMRRRVELARVLLCRPRLLLLDEPHAALDASARILVDHVTSQVAGRGGASVLVTHDPEAVAAMAPRLLRMSGGRLDEEPTP